MQLGIRLHDAVELPLEERLANINKQGFKCAHVALKKVISEYSAENTALTPGLAMYLKNLFAKNNIDVAVLGCYLNLATPDEAELKKTVETYMANIRFASILGCGVVGTETGAPNTEYKPVPECRSEEALQTFITNLKPIVEYAEKMGVIVAIEPVLRHIVYSPKRARQVLDAIQSPNLQIILDPVNLLGMENYENREAVIAEAIELLGEATAVVHIKDFVVGEDDLVSIAAGTGIMNYENLLRFMKKDKPYIHATLEDTNPENAVKARKYIQEIWDNL
ncbi:sugar phosphate isomerase/epimerase family protein [Konateibacter massiliensis]|uniref:sugar phosphate isomerase/epimerase family protein n=1 Tax=Konateibacter massiliensis TaxID=2002841 RepID=UPI000C1591C7|nr:sugar phosphate isomerase/epimerase family protein [Konateibacter massiliensis]